MMTLLSLILGVAASLSLPLQAWTCVRRRPASSSARTTSDESSARVTPAIASTGRGTATTSPRTAWVSRLLLTSGLNTFYHLCCRHRVFLLTHDLTSQPQTADEWIRFLQPQEFVLLSPAGKKEDFSLVFMLQHVITLQWNYHREVFAQLLITVWKGLAAVIASLNKKQSEL